MLGAAKGATSMNVTVFGGLNRRPLPPGWTKETMIVVFGGGELDVSGSPPGPDARLTVVAILGGLKIFVAAGTRVSVGGFGLFGGRKVEVSQVGDGPQVKMNLWVILGGVEVKELEQASVAKDGESPQ
jgi:hypothetical protein